MSSWLVSGHVDVGTSWCWGYECNTCCLSAVPSHVRRKASNLLWSCSLFCPSHFVWPSFLPDKLQEGLLASYNYELKVLSESQWKTPNTDRIRNNKKIITYRSNFKIASTRKSILWMLRALQAVSRQLEDQSLWNLLCGKVKGCYCGLSLGD